MWAFFKSTLINPVIWLFIYKLFKFLWLILFRKKFCLNRLASCFKCFLTGKFFIKKLTFTQPYCGSHKLKTNKAFKSTNSQNYLIVYINDINLKQFLRCFVVFLFCYIISSCSVFSNTTKTLINIVKIVLDFKLNHQLINWLLVS